jgi:hypothetical protein
VSAGSSRFFQTGRSRRETDAASGGNGSGSDHCHRPSVGSVALPILHEGSVPDGELIAGRFRDTMAAMHGSSWYQNALELVVVDVPILAGADLREFPLPATGGSRAYRWT